MTSTISHAPLAQRFEHLLAVLSSGRFLHMLGLNNDLPFYICEYPASEASDIERLQQQLTNLKLPLEMGVLSFVQNVDKELRNGGKASTCGIHAGI